MNGGELPEGWSVQPLSGVASLIAGQSPPSNAYRDTPVGLPFFQGKADFGQTHPIPRKWCDQPIKTAEPGDILLSVRAPVGPTNVADVRACVGRGLCVVRSGPALEQRYLRHFFNAIEPTLSALGSGSTFQAVSTRQVAALRVPFPSLSEQRRIADLLDAASVEVAVARSTIARQKEEVRDLLSTAVEAAMGGRAVAAADDPIASGPEWRPLSEVARLESGHTPSRKHPEWWGGDVSWIALPDIRALDGRTAMDTGERTNELGLANSSARLLPAGTVVLCRDVNVGLVTVLGRPMATSQHFVNWVPTPCLRSWYLARALIAARQYLRSISEGSLIKTIYMPTLKDLRLRCPPLSDQDRALARISEVTAAATDTLAALDCQAAALDALGPALLTAAFAGQL